MSFVLLGILQSQAAAGGAGAYDLLETQVLSSSASSVTFTGLDSYTDYKHLQIRFTGRSDRASAYSSRLRIRFNSDSGSNYANHVLYVAGSSVFSSSSTSANEIDRNSVTGSLTGANIFAAGIIDILDFANSSKNTTTRSLNGYAQTENQIRLVSGLWVNTAGVTNIELAEDFGANLVAGSRFSLYGIKG